MGRSGTRLLAALLGVGLAVTACQAPLEPESRQAASEPDAPSAAPSEAAPPEPTPSASRTPTRGPRPRAMPTPEISVPPGIEEVAPLSGPVLGNDVSWPQCPKGMGIPEKRTLGLPMPVPEAQYVVIGLTNGPGFTPNPCVESQLRWVEQRELLVSAYSVLSYPYGDQLQRYGGQGPYDASSRLGRLRNVGFQQARFNIATMERIGFRTPFVWLDVEPVPTFVWSADVPANTAIVEGAARGYTEAGYRIGVYSTAYLWQEIVGDFELGVPEWRAAGQTSRDEAMRRCGPDSVIQGGQPILSQWVSQSRDFNITCPGTSSRMTDYFFQT
jgi:hypothetical protein